MSRHSSLRSHHSSLESRRTTGLHSHNGRRNGISNTHAFAVGRATGANINGSAMGAHGVALYLSRQARDRLIDNSHRTHRATGSSFRKVSGRTGFASRSPLMNRRRLKATRRPSSSRRYTMKVDRRVYSTMPDEALNQFAKFGALAGVLLAGFMVVFFIIMFIVMGALTGLFE